MKIRGVLLAAGCSKRMGSANKLLLEYNKHTILEESLLQLSNSNLDEIIVITGFEHDKIESLVTKLGLKKVRCLFNEKHKDGRASSIHCAVHNLKDNSNALLFMVADKPMVQSLLIGKALKMFIENNPDILYVQTIVGRGHPIIYSEKMYSELLNLKGNLVGSDLIESNKSVTRVLKDNATQIDIDTYDDYLSLLNLGN